MAVYITMRACISIVFKYFRSTIKYTHVIVYLLTQLILDIFNAQNDSIYIHKEYTIPLIELSLIPGGNKEICIHIFVMMTHYDIYVQCDLSVNS